MSVDQPWSDRPLKATPINADELVILDSEDGNVITQNKRVTLGSLPSTGGEANTASNSGGGEGLVQTKSGVDLPFKSLEGETSKIILTPNVNTVTFTVGTDVVTIDKANTFGNFKQTFADNQFNIQNPATTATYQFIASAITADRSVTLPVLGANDTFVFENLLQTLTTKTIDAALNTISNIDETMQTVNTGAANTVLTSNGVGVAPTYQPGGTGDVVGPADATNEAIARFDETTGKLIQDSIITIDDLANLDNIRSAVFTTHTSGPGTATTHIALVNNDFHLNTITGNNIQMLINGVTQYKFDSTSADFTGKNLTIDNAFIQFTSISQPTTTGSDAVGKLFMDSGNNHLSILRNNTTIDLEVGGITSINGDTNAAQTLNGTANRITITDTGAGSLTFDTGSDIPTLSGTQTFTGTNLWTGNDITVTRVNNAARVNAVVFDNTGDPFKTGIFDGARARGTQASPSPVQDNDLLTSFSARGHDGTSFQFGGFIDITAAGLWSGTSTPSKIQFFTTPVSSTTEVEVLDIGSDGTLDLLGNDLVNAPHDHTNAAGGGQLLSTTALSDTGDIAYLNTTNAYTAGVRQDFLGLLAGTSGLNVGGIAGNPTTQVNGDIWLNTSSNQIFGRINGVDIDLGAGGGTGITSINGDTNAAQTLNGTANRITITDTGVGSLTFDTGTDVVTTTVTNVYTAGARQDFLGLLAGTSGLNVGGIAGNPTTQADGDIWLNTSSNQVFARINGADVDLGAGAAGGEVNTGANVGTGTGLVFRDKTGVTLNFKTLLQGSNITITNNADDITIAATGGTGDVVGPAGATDEALARFDETTGKLIKNSIITLDDLANLSAIRALIPTASGVFQTAGTAYFQYGDSGAGTTDFEWNILTGNKFRYKIQGTTEYLFDATGAIFSAGNNLTINPSGALGYIDIGEITTPANPASDFGRLYVEDLAAVTTLFFRDSAGTVTNLLAPSGDVFGPVGATDEAIARFDETTGKLIKNSIITIDDSARMSNIQSLVFATGTSPGVGIPHIAFVDTDFHINTTTGNNVQIKIQGDTQYTFNETSANFTGKNLTIDNAFIQFTSIGTPASTGFDNIGKLFMDSGNNHLSILRNTTTIDLEGISFPINFPENVGGNATVTQDISFSVTDRHSQQFTLTQDTTLTFSGTVPSTTEYIDLFIVQDGTGGHTLTLPVGTVNAAVVEAGINLTALAETFILLKFAFGTFYAFLQGGTQSGGSQTPILQDVDYDNFGMTDVDAIGFDALGSSLGVAVNNIWSDTGGININVPTGDAVDIYINGVVEYGFQSTRIQLHNNTLEQVGNVTLISSGTAVSAGASGIFDDSNDLKYNVQSGRFHIWTINNAEVLRFNTSIFDLSGVQIQLDANRSIGFDGATDAQKIEGDAGGITLYVPTADDFDYQVNSVSVATIAAASAAFHATNATQVLELEANHTTPADAQIVGQLDFIDDSLAGTRRTYGQIRSVIQDPTNSDEDGEMFFNVIKNGAPKDYLSFNSANGDQIGAGATLNMNSEAILGITNLTLTGTISGPLEINDTNGNELIIFTTTTDAVNELTLVNAATTNPVQLQATGGDFDVDVRFVPKGTGTFFGNRETWGWPLTDETTTPTTGVKFTTEPAPYDMLIEDVVVGLTTAGTTSTFTVDVLKEDTAPNTDTFTTIFSTKPTIDATEFTSTTAVTPPVISVATWEKGRRLQLSIDTLDTGGTARGVKVSLITHATAK